MSEEGYISEKTNVSNSRLSPKYLWFLILAYSMVLAISNWFDSRLVLVFGLSISPGALSFPFTFLISDIITEVYGYKNSRKAIWASFLFNVIFLVYGQIINHMPSPSFSTMNEAYSKILALNGQIIIASFLSYLIAEPINSYFIAKLKILTKGEFMSFRFIMSTIIASGIDSFLFGIIAFYGVIDINNIYEIIIHIWIVKSVVEILFIPISTRICDYIKKKEQIDIYDFNTKFNIFNFDSEYKPQCNKFNKP